MSHPDWLQPNKQVYSKEHGIIHVTAIIEDNLYFKKGNISQIIFNLQEQVNSGNLLPISKAPSGKGMLYQEIAAILDGAGKLKSCDIIPAQQAKLYPIPDDIHPAVRNALIKSGITQLYSHQVEAWEAYKQSLGYHPAKLLQAVVKSISFLIPIIHECLKRQVIFNFSLISKHLHLTK